MKYLLVLILACLSCAPPAEAPRPPPAPTSVAERVEVIRATTLALVRDGEIYCSGVWLAPDLILTAAHCVATNGPTMWAPHSDYDYRDDYNKRRRGSEAWLLRKDDTQDLALLGIVPTPLAHGTASLATREPQVRDEVIIVGHTLGMPFAYSPGFVDGVRHVSAPEIGIAGEFLQVWGGAYGGNSGGGVWDMDGQLLGVCSFRAGPLHWFVSTDAIRRFLDG